MHFCINSSTRQFVDCWLTSHHIQEKVQVNQQDHSSQVVTCQRASKPQASWEGQLPTWALRAPDPASSTSAKTNRIASWDAVPSIHARQTTVSALIMLSSLHRSRPMLTTRFWRNSAWIRDSSGTLVATLRRHSWDVAPRWDVRITAVRQTKSEWRL